MKKDTKRYIIEGISAAAIAVGSFLLGKKSANKSTNEVDVDDVSEDEYYLAEDDTETVEEATTETAGNDAE